MKYMKFAMIGFLVCLGLIAFAHAGVNLGIIAGVKKNLPSLTAATIAGSTAPQPTATPVTQVITTYAGTGIAGYSGDGGQATAADLFPSVIALDPNGNLYIGGYCRIRKIDKNTGVITTIAGNGTFGYSGDGGSATSAMIQGTSGMAFDVSGNLYFSETFRIRKVSGGIITTIAGNGTGGFSGDGGAGTAAQFNGPTGVAVDGSGIVYIADAGNYRIRRLAGGVISTVAGDGTITYGGENQVATSTGVRPQNLAFDSAGSLIFSELARIRKLAIATNLVTTVVGTGTTGFGGDGGDPTAALIYQPGSIAFTTGGDLYFADTWNHRVRKVSGGVITTVAGTGTAGFSGDGGIPTLAQLNYPAGVAVNASGDLFIADKYNNVVRRILH